MPFIYFFLGWCKDKASGGRTEKKKGAPHRAIPGIPGKQIKQREGGSVREGMGREGGRQWEEEHGKEEGDG